MAKGQIDSSNLKKIFGTSLALLSKLATTWLSSKAQAKEKLQKLIIPEGVVYDLKNQAFRTNKVNSDFQLIAAVTSGSAQNETRNDCTNVESNESGCARRSPPK